MGAGQVSGADQKLADDLITHEHKGLFEQRDPFFAAKGMVVVEPCGKRAVRGPQGEDAAGVLDHRFDLASVAYDARIG